MRTALHWNPFALPLEADETSVVEGCSVELHWEFTAVLRELRDRVWHAHVQLDIESGDPLES